MSKQLQSYTDSDKIKLFDKLYEMSRDEWRESQTEEDRDEHYFWEGVIETMLGKEIWTRYGETQ